MIANLHWFGDTIRDRFGDGSELGIELTYSEEEKLLGTAGGVRNVSSFFGDQPFVVMAADALTDIDLRALVRTHERNDWIATLAVKRVTDTSEYGVVVTGSDGRVQGFQEKPDAAEALSDLASCMIYVLEPEIFEHFPDRDEVDFALDVFPALLEADQPFGVHLTEDYWNDVGSLPEYLQGNLDVLTGAVDVDPAGELIDAGAAGLAAGVEVSGQVLLGEGAEVGEDARLEGPLVIGPGRRSAPARGSASRCCCRAPRCRPRTAGGGDRRQRARARRRLDCREPQGLLLDCGKPAVDLGRVPQPTTTQEERWKARKRTSRLTARQIAGGCGWAVVVLGAVVLVGWAVDSTALTRIAPGMPSMKPLTAVAMILIGAALVLLGPASVAGARHRLGVGLAATATLIAAAVLVEYVVGDLGIDDLLFGDAQTAGRPSSVTAIALGPVRAGARHPRPRSAAPSRRQRSSSRCSAWSCSRPSSATPTTSTTCAAALDARDGPADGDRARADRDRDRALPARSRDRRLPERRRSGARPSLVGWCRSRSCCRSSSARCESPPRTSACSASTSVSR